MIQGFIEIQMVIHPNKLSANSEIAGLTWLTKINNYNIFNDAKSDFFNFPPQTFGDLGITRKLIFFL